MKIQDKALSEKVSQGLKVFDGLDKKGKYAIAFSGGKDSHALLGLYLLWIQERKEELDIVLVFADTMLELSGIYELIENVERMLEGRIEVKKVKGDRSYWYYQFVLGYAVPDHRIRWCTSKLKIDPMAKIKRVAITGRHLGESAERDKRLNSCNSGECGIDKIKTSIDPLLEFRNCDVWDFIFYCDGTVLYEGVFNKLKTTYTGATDGKGSLRMGCIMCPVVSVNTLRKGDCSTFLGVRLAMEKLRGGGKTAKSKKRKKRGYMDRIKKGSMEGVG